MHLDDIDGNCVVHNLIIADTFIKRLSGLLGKTNISNDSGILLVPCTGIHTFFMRFPIDVYFLRKKEDGTGVFEVVARKKSLKPWRMAIAPAGTNAVLETGVCETAILKDNQQYQIAELKVES